MGLAEPDLRDVIERVAPLKHLLAAQASKRIKYRAWGLQHHHLVPAACDSYGGMGGDLHMFIKRVAAHATTALGAPSGGFLRFWRTALECEVHRAFAQSAGAHFWQQARGIPSSNGMALRATRTWGLGQARAEAEALD